MSPILILFAVAASHPTTVETENRRLTEQLIGCGLSGDQISISYRDELQDNEVLVTGLSASTDPGVWACLASVQREGVILAFDTTWGNRVLYEAYDRQFGEIDRTMARRLAQQWLDERGLFQDRPVFDPVRQTAEQYVRVLERFCGLPERTFVIHDNGFVLSQIPSEEVWAVAERLPCFMHVLALDDDASTQIGGLGFIGNETGSVDTPRP